MCYWQLSASCLFYTGSAHVSVVLSVCPTLSFPLLCAKIQSLHQHLCSCPANRYRFSRFCIYALICGIRFSLSWPTPLSMTDSRLIRITTVTQFHSFLRLSSAPSRMCTHLLCALTCWWTSRLLLCPGYCRDGGSLVGCRLWGRTESDTTEVT